MDAIGTISLSQTSEIIFYVDSYKGDQFANIRKFVKSNRYTGPTKKGVKLNREQLEVVYKTLGELSTDLEDLQEKNLITIPLSGNRFISVSVSYFNGEYGLDIRQHFKSKKYTGPSKKGVRIPIDCLGDMVGYCHKMLGVLAKGEVEETFAPKQKRITERVGPAQKTEKIEGVPNEYHKYF